MASVDERVVAMSFENTKFEANVSTTMNTLSKLDTAIRNIGSTSGLSNIEKDANKVTLLGPMTAIDKLKQKLSFGREAPQAFSEIENASNKVGFTGIGTALDKLKAKLGFPEAPQAFAQVEAASDKVQFAGIHRSIEGLGQKFSTLQVAAGVAFGNIATMGLQKIGGMIKSLSIAPLVQGFQEYSTNLNSIQTILANTKDSGGNLKTVNDALQQLNKYSDQTIYNFGQMARNIGTFTAAGVKLQPAVNSIKGIANLAALSGSNAEQASTAMYQLSQAIASGKVGLQDWNSVVNAGMGGAVFQKALMRTGENMGTIAEGAVKIDKATGKATINGNTFRDSIMAKPGQKSWLTSEVLVKTLEQFTGDMSDAQLKAQGFSDAQVKLIQDQARTAKKAATEVKTLSGVFDVVKESIGSGWSAVFQNIFGNFEESKKTFTELSTFITGFVSRTFGAFNSVLKEWKKLGGRTDLIEGIKAGFTALLDVLKPIKDAFRDIFPAKTGQDLADMTHNFREFMESIKPSEETMRNLHRTFAGVFAVLHIGWTIIKDVAKEFFRLFGVVGHGSGGFLNLTGTIGDFLVNIDKALTKGGLLTGWFNTIDPLVRIAVKLLKALASEIANLFTGLSPGKLLVFATSMDDMKKAAGPAAPIIDGISKAWDGFLHIVDRVKAAVGPTFKKIGEVIANFGKFVGDAIAHADYSAIFAGINTVLLGGIFLTIRKAIGGGIAFDLGGGVIKNISSMFEMLTGNLKAMQQNVQAKTLLAIAAALGILALAVLALSHVNPKQLASSMTAMAVGMGELVGAMAILNKAAGGTAFIRMPFIAGSMVILAGAIIVLAGAVRIFAAMSWEEMIRGLTGVAGALTVVGAASKLMQGEHLGTTAAALLPVAAALKLLASAAKDFASMSWGEIVRGLAGIGGSLVAIGLAMQTFPPNIGLQALSLIAISFALAMLSGAVAAFGAIHLENLLRGLFGLGASLVAIGTAIEFIPPTIGLQAAGLILLAIALTGLAGVVSAFGHMSIGTLVKGIIAMGGALVVLGAGLTAMEGTLPGSIALLAAAAAFVLLAPAIGLMGSLPWGVILKGLATMALTLGVLAVVGLAAAEPIALLGLALIPLGIGMAAIGAAVYLFAKGISLLSGTAVKAFATLLAAAGLFIASFPTLVINFVKGLVEVLQSVADLAPKIVTALVTIVNQLLDAIIRLAPKMGEAIGALITQILKVLNDNAGPIIQAGFNLLLNLLKGISDHIEKITEQGVAIVTKFLDTVAANAGKIVNSGLNVIVSFIQGITNGIPRLVASVAAMMTAFLNNVTKHIPEIINAAGNLIAKFITTVYGQVPKLVLAGINVIINFLQGVAKAVPRVVNSALDIAEKFINALARGLLRLVNVGFNAMIRFMNGLADSIRKNEPRVFAAGMNIAGAIVQGMMVGMLKYAQHLFSKAMEIAHHLVHILKHPWDIFSPSRVTQEIGKNIMLGFAKGFDDNSKHPVRALSNAQKALLKQAKQMAENFPELLSGAQPVITPVVDATAAKAEISNLMDQLHQVNPLIPGRGIVTAVAIASQQRRTTDTAQVATATPGATITLNQNNYSPDPLSNTEIYRQTNNQLSRLRAIFGVPSGLSINVTNPTSSRVAV